MISVSLLHTEMKMYAELLPSCSTWLTLPGIIYPKECTGNLLWQLNSCSSSFSLFLFLIKVSLNEIRVLPWFPWWFSCVGSTMQRPVSQWKAKRNNSPSLFLTIHHPILLCMWRGSYSSLKKYVQRLSCSPHYQKWPKSNLQVSRGKRRKHRIKHSPPKHSYFYHIISHLLQWTYSVALKMRKTEDSFPYWRWRKHQNIILQSVPCGTEANPLLLEAAC